MRIWSVDIIFSTKEVQRFTMFTTSHGNTNISNFLTGEHFNEAIKCSTGPDRRFGFWLCKFLAKRFFQSLFQSSCANHRFNTVVLKNYE